MRRVNYALLHRLASVELPVKEGHILSDMTVQQVDALQGARAIFKKLEDLVHPDASKRAIEKFFDCNEACKDFVLEPKRLYDDLLINEVKGILDDWLHPDGVPLGLADFAEVCSLGSGANIKSDDDSFYTKLFDSPLSASDSSLYVLYRTAISRNPTWAQAEAARSASHGEFLVGAGSITTVPKQFDIERTVITEPTLNMWFQRGLGLRLDSILLKRTGISLTYQPDHNREMARLGSIDGSFGTIDLSSASDRIALSLCEEILPLYFVRWLKLLRTKRVRRPDGSERELYMVSSMGNGFTFSLQTMIFASIVIACYRLLGIKALKPRNPKKIPVNLPLADEITRIDGSRPGNFGVFGDDIIVCREAYDYVVHALELFGFVVNTDKSFNTGDFRESCGSDYWRGSLVRGCYIKHLETPMDCYSAINRLIAWSARTSVTVELLVAHLMTYVRFLPIPRRDGDDEGFKVPWSLSRVDYFSCATRSPLYWALVTLQEGWRVPLEPAVEYKRIPYSFVYNGAGITVALVGGFVKGGRIVVSRERDERPVAKVRLRSVPFWDYNPEPATQRDDAWFSVVARCLEIGPWS